MFLPMQLYNRLLLCTKSDKAVGNGGSHEEAYSARVEEVQRAVEQHGVQNADGCMVVGALHIVTGTYQDPEEGEDEEGQDGDE
jgi:hypothetical protein